MRQPLWSLTKIGILMLLALSSSLYGQTHFTPVWSGTPFQAMNIYVSAANVNGVDLAAGDEIGVFDGKYCVGTKVLTGAIVSGAPLALVVSTDDPTTPGVVDGFTVGNTISYKVWVASSSTEYSGIVPTYSYGAPTFSSLGTSVVSLTVNTSQLYDISPAVWEGYWWSQNVAQSAWFPPSGSPVDFGIDNYSWGQIRTKNTLPDGTAMGFDVTMSLNSGGINGNMAYFGFGDQWVLYGGSFYGVKFYSGNVMLSKIVNGGSEEQTIIGSYVPGDRIVFWVWLTPDGSVQVSSPTFSGTLTPVNPLASGHCMMAVANATPGHGFSVYSVSHASTPPGLFSAVLAQYSFNGNANDGSGNNRTGTVYGASPTMDRFGNQNSAYSFDGSSNGIVFPGFNLPVNAFSFSLWFTKPQFSTSASTYEVLFSDAGRYQGTRLYLSHDSLNFEIQQGSTGNAPPGKVRDVAIAVSDLSPNTWYHVAGSSINGTLSLYLNGALRRTYTDYLGDNGAAVPFTIGRDAQISTGYFNGVIDDITLFNRELSLSEINQLYHTQGWPISVSAPTTGTIWQSGSTQTVTWTPGGVQGNVNILLSADGGLTFGTILAQGTPNDGTEQVTVPNQSGTSCRVRVVSSSEPSTYGDNPGNFKIVQASSLPAYAYTRMTFQYVYQPAGTTSFGSGTMSGQAMLSGTKTNPWINADKCGFTFASQSISGLVSDMYYASDSSWFNTLWANNGWGGIIDMGAIDFNSMNSVPKKTDVYYNSQGHSVIVNHVYGVLTRDSSHYAKILVTKIDTVYPGVTFQVDMRITLREGTFRPDLGDHVLLRGTFNNWGLPDTLSDPDGDSVYTRTLLLSPGPIEFKFYKTLRATSTWEDNPNPSNPPYGNRQYTVGTGGQTLIPVYFNNDSVYAPLQFVQMTFRVNMGVYISSGLFSPTRDSLFVKGSFNDNMLIDPLNRIDSVYTRTISLLASKSYSFKYWINTPNAVSGGWEYWVGTADTLNGNRLLNTGATDLVLPTVNFNSVMRETGTRVIADNFDSGSLNRSLWHPVTSDTGLTARVVNKELKIAGKTSATTYLGGGITTLFCMPNGSFTVEASFEAPSLGSGLNLIYLNLFTLEGLQYGILYQGYNYYLQDFNNSTFYGGVQAFGNEATTYHKMSFTYQPGTLTAKIDGITIASIPRTLKGVRFEMVYASNTPGYDIDVRFDNFVAVLSPGTVSGWQNTITVADGCGGSGPLVFGAQPGATNGLDAALGECELPPPPPGGFDTRFVLPVVPAVSSPKDFRSDTLKSDTWRMMFQPGSCGYPLTFSWDSTAFPMGFFNLKDEVTGTIVNVNMKAQQRYTLSIAGITSLKIEYAAETCKDLAYAAGWNIISVPVKTLDSSVVGLYPGATSSAYSYNNGYTAVTALSPGRGYWLKFPVAETLHVCGTAVSPRDVSFGTGWSMIGPFDLDVPVSSISTTPTGLVTSDFFGYSNGYQSAVTLQGGKGYWVKLSQPGVLHLTGGVAKAVTPLASQDTRIVLHIEDKGGASASLYLAKPQELKGSNELPPLPPTGIFDVRFAGNTYVEELGRPSHEVQITSGTSPVTICALGLGGRVLKLKDNVNGQILDVQLVEGKQVTVPQGLTRLEIEESDLIPLAYELSQNYPNPFNPTTTIKFALPRATYVTLEIFNTLGQNVLHLVDANYDAGYHEVKFDASNLASGTYFYRIRAGQFVAVKKLMILK